MPAAGSALCGNCKAPLYGPYCAQCGQRARDRLVPFRQFVRSLVRDFFSFDTRFFRTLGPLLFRPGRLTNEYVAGRRARYMPPIRLYVAMSVLFFFTAALLRLDSTAVFYSEPETADEATEAPATPPAEPAPPAEAAPPAETASSEDVMQEGLGWYQRLKGPGIDRLRNDPAAFSRVFMDRIPAMMFVLLPVFALLLKLFYIRHAVLYAQHFIFALHLHAFGFFALFLLLAIDGLVVPLVPEQGTQGANFFGILFLLTAWVYLFIGLRRVYGQSRGKTLLKIVLLTFSYLTLFVVGLAVVFIVTLLF